MIASPNVFISSREIVDPLTDRFRGTFSYKYAQKIKLIRMMNIVPTTFFFPSKADPTFDHIMKREDPFNFLKIAL